MSYKVWALSTTTWGDKVLLEPTTCPWGKALNGGKGGSATFNLGDPAVAEVAGPFGLSVLDHLLVVEHADKIVYAGFITDHDYDRDSMVLTVTHSDIWWILARRFVLSMSGNGAQTTPLSWSGKTLETLAKNVVYEGQDAGPESRYKLPIVYPPDVNGTQARTYFGYQFPLVDEALLDIINSEGGPNIDFTPRWANGGTTIEWVMRAGQLQENNWEWDLGAAESPARGLRMRRSGEKLATKIIATGEGTEAAMLVRSVDNFAVTTFPAVEMTRSYKGVSNVDVLRGMARGDLAAYTIPTWQGSFQVPHDGEPNIAQILPGDRITWSLQGDPYINGGKHQWQVIDISGDLSEFVTLNIQPL